MVPFKSVCDRAEFHYMTSGSLTHCCSAAKLYTVLVAQQLLSVSLVDCQQQMRFLRFSHKEKERKIHLSIQPALICEGVSWLESYVADRQTFTSSIQPTNRT